jgi:trehalose 6-phosphate phosphatase
MASNLFTSAGLAALAHYIAPGTLFAFDLDGTLAPIVDDYSAARVAEPVRMAMKRLISLAKVAVVTGRSRKDAWAILGFEPHLLIGNHGAEWPDGPHSRTMQFTHCCASWREKLQEILPDVQGLEIEFKGESISLHYRKAMDREYVLAQIHAAIGKLDPGPKIIGGKCVINLLPKEALTKGDALMAAMARTGSTRTIYFGDDETDEIVFQMKRADVFSVHIGKNLQTSAPYYLDSQADIHALLNCMICIVAQIT